MSGERIVKVLGKPQTITVAQQSKSVWIAVGDYMGESFDAKGRTEKSATAAWIAKATYHGNDPPPKA
ncbi:hypothetical protein SAMN05519104_4777 [Rhizobiales bacterium GAS188]|nr:hypothetical protein SAMN05519104_4777 [Rhizobiales bacterium GAS188]